jgi:predicted RNA-binding protein associated with RNAse of E/G family
MLNRKYADCRHAPELDPRVLAYDAAALPQAVVAIGPRAARKTKDGVVLAEPGFTWAVSYFPGEWYTITSIYDAHASLVAHHVDLCVPPEEVDGVLTFLDLKLDLLIRPGGERAWLDQDDYDRELAAGTVPSAWQEAVDRTRAELDRRCAAGAFPPPAVTRYRPPTAAARATVDARGGSVR